MSLAFMDVFPQSRGHVLVIPKTPARNFLDVEPESLSPLIIETQRLAKAVQLAKIAAQIQSEIIF